MGGKRGCLLRCTQPGLRAVLHAVRDLLGTQGKQELRWGEMHPFAAEKRQHLTQADIVFDEEVPGERCA